MKPDTGHLGPNSAAVRSREAVAPLWHTIVLLILYLGLDFIRPGGHGLLWGIRDNVGLIAVCVIWVNLFFAAICCLGPLFSRSDFSHLLGERCTDWRYVRRDIPLGLLLGAATIGTSVLFHITLAPHGGDSGVGPVANNVSELTLQLLSAVAAGLAEELIFRGYLLRQIHFLTGSLGVALLAQAVLFGLSHGLRQAPADLALEISTGLLLGTAVARRRSILPAIVAHASANAFVFLLWFYSR